MCLSLSHSLCLLFHRLFRRSEYRFPLYGHCVPPKAQGPIVCQAGVPATVLFKNVFPRTETFLIVVDNPLFEVNASMHLPWVPSDALCQVSTRGEKIDAKKVVSLNVTFRPPGFVNKPSKDKKPDGTSAFVRKSCIAPSCCCCCCSCQCCKPCKCCCHGKTDDNLLQCAPVGLLPAKWLIYCFRFFLRGLYKWLSKC